MPLVGSPPSFDGTLEELFKDYIRHLLPEQEEVEWLHHLLVEHTRTEHAAFVVRQVAGLERGEVYRTRSGDQLIPSDNAPAWWMHHVAFHRLRPHDLSAMPTHMFKVRSVEAGINAAGWHVAHIFDAKDRNTDWQNWSRRELVKRFIRNLHPCNTFYIPKTGWQAYGGRPEVIAFFAEVYSKRYANVWDEFVRLAEGTQLAAADGALRYRYERDAPVGRGAVVSTTSDGVAVSYRYNRLCFKADLIDPLADDDVFEVITQDGSFRMTKREFHRDFAGVLTTRSYSEGRIYHYPKLPRKALKYRAK